MRRIVPGSFIESSTKVEAVKRKLLRFEKKTDSPEALQQAKSEFLWWAARWKNIDVLKFLLDSNQGDPTHKLGGLTALHRGAANGDVQIMKMLLDAKVNVDIQDDRGFTPLFWSVAWNRPESIGLLLSEGANATRSSPWKYTNEYVKILIENYDDEESNLGDELFCHFEAVVIENCKLSNCPVSAEITKAEKQFWKDYLLFKASDERNDVQLCRKLLSLEAQPGAVIWLVSAIHVAVICNNEKILEMYLENKALVDVETGLGLTSLCYAARRGHKKCADRLILHGASVSYKTIDGTPLDMVKSRAMKTKDPEILELSLDWKGPLNKKPRLENECGQSFQIKSSEDAVIGNNKHVTIKKKKKYIIYDNSTKNVTFCNIV